MIAASVPLAAQNDETPSRPVLNVNSDHWTMLPNSDGTFAVFHNQSGAFCTDTFRELQLSDVTSYTEDGTDVSCSYQIGSGFDMTRLTTYIFQKPGLSGPMAFSQALGQIAQLAENSGLSAERNSEHSERCYNSVLPLLSDTISEQSGSDEAGNEAPEFNMGTAMFDYTFTPSGSDTQVQQTSLLTVYSFGGWIVKTRFTGPEMDQDQSYAKACNYSGLANIALATAIGQNGS